MDDSDKLKLISASTDLRAAVGAFGQIYVWGNNHRQGLGFDDVEELQEPTFVELKHNYYSVKAKEVCCGSNFIVVLAHEEAKKDASKQARKEERKEDHKEEDSNEERKGDSMEGRREDSMEDNKENDVEAVSREDARTCLKEELDEGLRKLLYMLYTYCFRSRKSLIDIYRSLKLKELSFISITKNEIIMRFDDKFKISEELLRKIMEHLGMFIPGRRINILPLYEHLEAYTEFYETKEAKASMKQSEQRAEGDEVQEEIFEIDSKICKGKGLLFIFGCLPTDRSETYERYDLTYQVFSLRSTEYFTKIACGDNFVVAVTSEDRVFNWASDINCHIISQKYADRFNTPHTVLLSGWMQDKLKSYHIVDVAAGKEHIMVSVLYKQTYNVYTWGKNDEGCLGLGHIEPMREPVQVQGIRETERFQIAAGFNQSLVILATGSVKGWGKVPNRGRYLISNIPTDVEAYTDVKHIACGETYNLVLNTHNELVRIGNNEAEAFNYTLRDEKLNVALFTQVCGSDSVFMALTSLGAIYSWTPLEWRSEETKEEEDESNLKAHLPKMIEAYEDQFAIEHGAFSMKSQLVDVSKSRKIKKVAATSLCSFAMTEDGQMYSTGSGVYGMLGKALDEDDEEVISCIDKFTPIQKISGNSKFRVTDIACGTYHIMTITDEGLLMGWGRNDCGQLGLGHLEPYVRAPTSYDFEHSTESELKTLKFKKV
jgi:alpha-tubulin suppressor-like RCC1 family protein